MKNKYLSARVSRVSRLCPIFRAQPGAYPPETQKPDAAPTCGRTRNSAEVQRSGFGRKRKCGGMDETYRLRQMREIAENGQNRGILDAAARKRAAYRETCTRGIIVGVVLCILSAIPVLLGTLAADSVAAPERIMLPCVSLLLAMVAVAVYLFVRVGMVQGSFQRLLEEGDYTRVGKRAARSPIVPIYWCLATAAYLAWSFITMAWDRTWIVWPVAGVLFAAVVGIIRMTHKEGRKEKKAG